MKKILLRKRLSCGENFIRLGVLLVFFFLKTDALYAQADVLTPSNTNTLLSRTVHKKIECNRVYKNNIHQNLELRCAKKYPKTNEFANADQPNCPQVQLDGCCMLKPIKNQNTGRNENAESSVFITFIPLLLSSLLTFFAFWCRSFFKFLHNRKVAKAVIMAIHSDVKNGLEILEEIIDKDKENKIPAKILPVLNWEKYYNRIDGDVLNVLLSDTVLEDSKIKSCELKSSDVLQHFNNYFSYVCVAVNTMLREIKSKRGDSKAISHPHDFSGLTAVLAPTVELSGSTLMPGSFMNEAQDNQHLQCSYKTIETTTMQDFIAVVAPNENSKREIFYKYIKEYHKVTKKVFLMNEAIIASLSRTSWVGMFLRWLKGKLNWGSFKKNALKKILVVGMMFCSSALLADSWTDPATGITWKYKITNEAAKEASLGDNGSCISTATAGYLVVPERINGYAIVEVGNGAFNSCSRLTGITLPSTLRTVVNTWFSGLTSVQILKSPAEMENLFPNGVSSSSALREIYTGSRPFDVRISKKLVRIYCLPKYKKLWEDQIRADTSDQTNTYPPAGQIELIPMGNSVKVIPSVHNAGVIKRNTLPTIDNLYDWGASVSVTATPKEGYVFLGWSSDIEGVSGADATLTFTMPERDITLVPNFFPKALIMSWINESSNGGTDIEKLVKEEVQKQAEPFKQAGVEEALKNGAVQTKGN